MSIPCVSFLCDSFPVTLFSVRLSGQRNVAVSMKEPISMQKVGASRLCIIQRALAVWVTLITVTSNCSLVISQEESVKIAEFAETAWFAETAKLRSGSYEIQGAAQKVNKPKVNLKISGQFDYAAGLQRFERWQSDWVEGGGIINSEGESIQFVSDGANNALWLPGSHLLCVSSECGRIPAYDRVLSPFDVRIMGMKQADDFSQAMCDFPKYFEAFWSTDGYKLESALDGENSIEVTWSVQGIPNLFRNVVFDKKSSLLPTELRLYFKEPAGDREIWEVNATWISINGAYVPSEVQMITRPSVDSEESSLNSVLDYSFKWISVNEEMDRSLFAEASLNTDPDSVVMDYSGAEPLFLRRVDDPELKASLAIAEKPRAVSSSASSLAIRKLLLIANILLGGLVAMFFLYRKWRAPKSAS